MGKVGGWIGNGLLLAAMLLLIAVSIPLLAVLVFLLRPILVVAAVVGLAAVLIAAFTSERFREWITWPGSKNRWAAR